MQDLRRKIEAKEAEIKEQQVQAAKADPELRLVLERQVAADKEQVAADQEQVAAVQEQVAALQEEVLVLRQKGQRLDTQQSAGETCSTCGLAGHL